MLNKNKLQEIIMNNMTRIFNAIDDDIDSLSWNDLAWIKCVSTSSIKSMKDKNYDNEKILTTFKKEADPEKKKEKAKKTITTLTDEQLRELGLVRI